MRSSQEFPEAARPGLTVWREVVEEIHTAHPGRGDRMPPLNGRGEPVGPKRWGDGHSVAWKVFVVLFLPGPDGTPYNHHLSVEFEPDGRTRIVGGSHLGHHFEIRRPRDQRADVALFASDLRGVARMLTLLPPEPPADLERLCAGEIANAYVAGRNAESLGLPWEHTV